MSNAHPMNLGNFSVSLAVKDLAASRAFYQTLGFEVSGGDPAQNWLILQNGSATIGLFQGMFERNLLTFIPVEMLPATSSPNSPMSATSSADCASTASSPRPPPMNRRRAPQASWSSTPTATRFSSTSTCDGARRSANGQDETFGCAS